MPCLAASRMATALAPIVAAALAVTLAVTLAFTAPHPQAAPPDTPVKVPKPRYAPRALVLNKMRDTMPEYARLPGLAHKAFSFAQPGGEYGGLYLWTSGAAARAWFNPAWFERVQRERGVSADVRMFDAPVVLDNAAGRSPQAAAGAARGVG
jgi:hypothetical protein